MRALRTAKGISLQFGVAGARSPLWGLVGLVLGGVIGCAADDGTGRLPSGRGGGTAAPMGGAGGFVPPVGPPLPATGGTPGTGGTGTGGTGTGGSGTGGSGGSIGGSGGVGGSLGGGGGAGGSSGGAGGEPGVAPPATCSPNLLPLPDDPGARGPWEVGVRTVTMGRLTAEVLYPAEEGSTDGLTVATYDIRDWLPPSQRDKVPDDASPAVTALGGGIYRDVPIDSAHGPYPVVIMIHGTASVRIASGSINAHWASRGFVVVAADYPGLGLEDKLNENPECALPLTGAQDIPGDVNTQIAAFDAATGDLGFLSGAIDMFRIGISGHSQGACAASQLGTLPNVRVVVPLTGSTVTSQGPNLVSVMYVAGMADTVIGYDAPLVGNLVCPLGVSNVAAYEGSVGPPAVKKRIVGITGGGHLVPTDLCQTNQYGRNAVDQALLDGVCGINGAVFVGLPALFDCGTIDWARGNEVVWHASTLALEEGLHCMDRTARFASLRADVPEIGDFREAL